MQYQWLACSHWIHQIQGPFTGGVKSKTIELVFVASPQHLGVEQRLVSSEPG